MILLFFVKLFDRISVLLTISEIVNCLFLIPHLHILFFVSDSYSINVQLFSHIDKLLLLYSSCLSLIRISVPFSVV